MNWLSRYRIRHDVSNSFWILPLTEYAGGARRRSAERFFAEPEDRALAGVGDRQGVGGKVDKSQSRDTRPDGVRPIAEAAPS